MTEQRPRPQYGEYATPEEQVSASGGIGAAPVAAPVVAPASGLAAASATPRPWDLSATVFLLALNAFMVLTSIPDYLNLSATLITGYNQLGYGEYTSTELANAIGLGIVAIQVALLIAVLYLSFRRIRAQRRAFPIAIGLGALAVVITVVLLMVAMTSDPALAAYVAAQTN